MSPLQHDQVIDDDELETCPLCIEEFDLSDRSFYPCPCSYQICQFCYNNIKTTMNGLCPACRRPYDDKNVRWEAPSAEEQATYKENLAQQAKRKAAARQKEAQRREADTLSRKHLAGIRVRRQNLVYVTGLRLNTSDPQLSEKLRGDQFFGQYGRIDKIVVNKPKESRSMQPVGVYITYFDKHDAALCIDMVNGTQNAGGVIRADYGTTKYCSAYLRNEVCTNRNCTFLHDVGGEDNESFTREGLSSLNANQSQSPTLTATNQAPPPLPSKPLPPSLSAPAMEHQDSRDGTSPIDSSDGSALPSTASWAQRNISRRSSLAQSMTTSNAPQSPAVVPALPVPPPAAEVKPEESRKTSAPLPTRPPPGLEHVREQTPRIFEQPPPRRPVSPTWARIKALLIDSEMKFTFDTEKFESDPNGRRTLQFIDSFPPLFDSNGGAKRQTLKRQVAERARLEHDRQVAAQALSALEPDEHAEGGSLQLGGEPEDRTDLDAILQQHAIQPPTQGGMSGSFSSDTMKSLQLQQQQQLLLQQLKSASPSSSVASHPPPGVSGHTRQASRFSFANDSSSASASVKPVANAKLMNQQSSMMPSQPTSQYNPFQQSQTVAPGYQAGAPGPPPGLKATGTPSISGGGMFGQGHGFATAGLGYGVNSAGRTANDDMMRDLLRTRGGSTGSGETPENARPDLTDSSILQARMRQTSAGSQGLYGAPGQGQDRTNDTLTPLHEDPFFGPSRSSSFVFSRPDEFSRRSTPSIPPGLAPSSTGPSFASFQDAPAVPDEVQGRKVPAFYGLGVTPTKPSKSERQKAERRSPSPIKTESAQDVVPREPLGGPAAEQPPIQPAMSAIDTTSFPALPTPSVVVSASRQTKAEKAAERALARMQKDDRNKENVPMVKKSDIEKPSVVIKSEPEKVAEPVPQVQISEQAQHPAKVDLTKVNEELASSSATIEKHSPTSSAVAVSKPSTPSQPSRDMTGTPSTISRPATPSASIVETPVKRTTQPRTIRVLATTTPKTENPPLVPAITELKASTPISRPTPAGSKQPSRQGSVISLDIPGTPVSERISDTVSVVTDADSVSRADSPPTGVNRVGSAPVRSKTKSQVKKDRQERAKAEEKKSIESQVEATPVEAIVQEPIMGRKKKAKKAPAVAGTATSTPGPSRPPSPKPKAANVEPQPPVPTPEQPKDQASTNPKPTPPARTPEFAAVRPVTPPPRVEPVPTMKAVEPTPPSQMMSPVTPRSPPSFQASVLAGLEAAGELQPELLNFFKMLPTFDFKHDVTGADLSDISHTIPLTKAELAKLDAGEAVRRGGEGGRSFSRVMLTPSRKALRALSQEQEDRYLELEASVAATKPPYKYTHKSSTIDMQYLVDNILLEAGAQMLQPPKAAPVAATTQPNNNVEIQTVYGDDALRFLNQYILPTPVPSASASTVAPVHVSEARLANRMVSRRVPPAWPERTDAEQASVREANDRVIQMHAEHMEYLAEKARQIAENPDADVFGPNSTNAPSSADHRKIKQAFHKAVQGVVQVAAGIASSMGQVGGGHAQVDDRVQQSQAQAQAQPQLQDQRFDTAAYEAKRVVEIEREYQQKKKEVEKFEKQMAGLVKKNRKIMGMTGVGTVV